MRATPSGRGEDGRAPVPCAHARRRVRAEGGRGGIRRLNNCNLGDDGVTVLAGAFKSCPTLRKIS